ncbi:MAG: diacylglycerol kinase [Marinilabiliales bacterium]
MEKFDINKRKKSFKYAFNGIGYAFKTQPNLLVHSVVAILVIAAAIILKISLYEWALIVFAIGLVITAELINTAIEYLVDLISPGYNKKAGLVKDISAGFVLIASISAFIIGLIIFIPAIISNI